MKPSFLNFISDTLKGNWKNPPLIFQDLGVFFFIMENILFSI